MYHSSVDKERGGGVKFAFIVFEKLQTEACNIIYIYIIYINIHRIYIYVSVHLTTPKAPKR